ncbi:radical SAM protein [Candidatus Poribacteria bacterium]|nr:radical SAM protein [Candidatus Poribacteria bacterium]
MSTYPSDITETRPEPRHHLVLQWHITDRCNRRCSHCYQESYEGEELPFRDLLTILKQFRQLAELCDSRSKTPKARAHINVTGGEPFIRTDFPQLLEAFHSNREWLSFGILTNGSFIDLATAHRLRELGTGYVQVSIEGTRERNDSIRGPGAWDQTVTALKNLARERIRTAISFTAQRSNFREFDEVARLGREVGATRVWSDRIIPSGNGVAVAEEVLSPEETREFLEAMHKAHAEGMRRFCRTEVFMRRALQFLFAGGTPYRCAAGDTLVSVMPNGDLYPCRRMPIRVGNLMEKSLAELYAKSELLRALRDHSRVNQGCEQCSFSRSCGGGLRCLSYAMTGDPFRADPGCWRARGQELRVGSKSPAEQNL